jgi:hypothetical protein
MDHSNLVDHPELPEIPYLEPGTDIHQWIQQVAAALVFHGAGFHDASIDWPAAVVFSPTFLPGPKAPPLALDDAAEWLAARQRMADAADESFDWLDGWSAQPKPYPPDVFAFRVAFDDEGSVGLRLLFYGDSLWYVIAPMSDRTRRALRQKLAKV